MPRLDVEIPLWVAALPLFVLPLATLAFLRWRDR